jgi:AraC family ethanolamine operon transcriptional activator
MRRAMQAIEESQTLPTAADLARLVAVTDRTLLRAFHETFGLPPKKYLMLRQLHQIQRVLKRGVEETATVADVLARHGIWEFGRFAGRYRGHFGELPSETLLRSRA